MSIATEIQRLQLAKEDIKSAIVEKGGTIEDGALIDTYGDSIRGIDVVGGDISKFGIQNEATGTGLVTLDYVNENEHDVEVKLSSDTVTDFSGVEVKCIGKNLYSGCDVSGTKDATTTNFNPIPAGIYTLSADVESTDTDDTKQRVYVYFADGTSKAVDMPRGARSVADSHIVVNSEIVKMLFRAAITDANSNGDTFSFKNIQLAPRTATTDYEPYTEKIYTANADGTVDGVTSISPIMNIICDGVDITAKYYCVPDAEWNRFWDNFQNYGKRTSYRGAFTDYGYSWNDNNYNPKYPITIKSSLNGGYNIFQNSDVITDTKVDIICLDNVLLNGAFQSADKLETIRKLVVNENVSYSATFQASTNIKNIFFEGVIGNSINLQWSSSLTVESAKNIIQCLANYNGTSNDLVNTITFHADVWSALDEEGNTSPNGNAWKNYITDIGWNWS